MFRKKEKESHITPSTAASEVGIRCSQRVALPLHREMESLWKRWWVVFHGGIPRRFPKRWPMLEMVLIASLLQPLKVSTTKGVNETPTDRQAPK